MKMCGCHTSCAGLALVIANCDLFELNAETAMPYTAALGLYVAHGVREPRDSE